MKEKPIIFSAPMVRAIMAGHKTQARRVVKPPRSRERFVLIDNGNGWWPYQSDDGESELCNDGIERPYICPYGAVGDQLWVREAWGKRVLRDACGGTGEFITYRASSPDAVYCTTACGKGVPIKWKLSIHMKRVDSRIQLEITAIRVERLQDISEADAIAEGIDGFDFNGARYWRDYGLSDEDAECSPMRECPIESYRTLWESINGRESWAANPWVWVVEFKRVTP